MEVKSEKFSIFNSSILIYFSDNLRNNMPVFFSQPLRTTATMSFILKFKPMQLFWPSSYFVIAIHIENKRQLEPLGNLM